MTVYATEIIVHKKRSVTAESHVATGKTKNRPQNDHESPIIDQNPDQSRPIRWNGDRIPPDSPERQTHRFSSLSAFDILEFHMWNSQETIQLDFGNPRREHRGALRPVWGNPRNAPASIDKRISTLGRYTNTKILTSYLGQVKDKSTPGQENILI